MRQGASSVVSPLRKQFLYYQSLLNYKYIYVLYYKMQNDCLRANPRPGLESWNSDKHFCVFIFIQRPGIRKLLKLEK